MISAMLGALWDKHKRWIVGAAAVLALLAAAFAAGRYSAPTKTVETTSVVHSGSSMEATEWGSAVRERITEGPVRVVTRWRDSPAAPGCPPVHEVEQTEDRGPVVTDRSGEAGGSSVSAAQSTTSATTTKIVTADRPRLALELGGQWPLKDPQLAPERVELAGSVRLVGGVWITVGDDAPTDKLGDLEQHRASARLRVEW